MRIFTFVFVSNDVQTTNFLLVWFVTVEISNNPLCLMWKWQKRSEISFFLQYSDYHFRFFSISRKFHVWYCQNTTTFNHWRVGITISSRAYNYLFPLTFKTKWPIESDAWGFIGTKNIAFIFGLWAPYWSASSLKLFFIFLHWVPQSLGCAFFFHLVPNFCCVNAFVSGPYGTTHCLLRRQCYSWPVYAKSLENRQKHSEETRVDLSGALFSILRNIFSPQTRLKCDERPFWISWETHEVAAKV